MQPYTFKDTLVGGHETKTALKLSASTVTDGQEKSLSLAVTVTPVFSGHPAGPVTPGTYQVVAAYAGRKSSDPSSSPAQTLTVQKA